ncbi:MAG: hypothetical protein R8N23_08115 [Reichenbachiella sp.]|uniref:hypothetical protein n=1 Tax=Reichenbachiella sp. TaxID=2184521 RepID=UPI002966F27D|nr:hypothetical protein [Reichenbachiella sp.]MDW3209817.1 hypothetical protein [Reichenbachiella sp.]
MMIFRWSRMSLIFLLVIALIGTLLRGAGYFQLPFSFEYLRHSHSHVAFQGWIYTLMVVILTYEFIPPKKIKEKKYEWMIGVTGVIIVGILVSFALQGYAFFSILFSSLFQLMSYWFTFRFFKDVEKPVAHILSLKWIRTGLWLGILSSIAPWFVGVISAKGMAGSELYQSVIYFFLHFQYNGWFVFVAIGLFYLYMERSGIKVECLSSQRFYTCWLWAVGPAYCLSLLGMSFSDWVRIPSLIAALLQGLGLIYFVPIVLSFYKFELKKKGFWVRNLLLLSFISFLLKTTLQCISVFPQLQELAFFSRNIVMAYMHLSLIGVLTFFFLVWLLIKGWIPNIKLTRVGLVLVVIGFLATEIILVVSGLGWWYPYFSLFIFSVWMALGICLLLIAAVMNPDLVDIHVKV